VNANCPLADVVAGAPAPDGEVVFESAQPFKAHGRVEVVTYGTSTDSGDVFKTCIFKLGDAGSLAMGQGASIMAANRIGVTTAGDAVQVVLPGKKPSVTMVDTIEIPATASGVDRNRRTVTLVLSDGRSAVVRVDPGVKTFSSLKAGMQVAVRLTQATALSVR